MSWDVIAVSSRQKLPPFRELPKGWQPEVMGSREDVRAKISAQLGRLVWSSDGFAAYIGQGFSFEILIPPEGDVRAVYFAVRGGGDPLPDLVRIAKSSGWWLLDESTGDWIDLDSPSRRGWEGFQAYRDRVVSGKPARSSRARRPPVESQPPKANREHVEVVKRGTDALKKWKKEHPFQLLKLSGANLQGIDLSGANLTGCDFRGTDLAGANLSEAMMQAAKLRAANVSNANLSRAKMDGSDLREANFNGAVLAGADLGGDQLGEANLSGINLRDADLTDVNLTGVVVEAEDWFDLLRHRDAAPRDVEKLESLWKIVPAGRLKIVVGGIVEADRPYFQIVSRRSRRKKARKSN